MDEEYLLSSPANEGQLHHAIKETGESGHFTIDVIDQDGEKFVVLPDSVLEQCGVGDSLKLWIEKGCIKLKALDKQ